MPGYLRAGPSERLCDGARGLAGRRSFPAPAEGPPALSELPAGGDLFSKSPSKGQRSSGPERRVVGTCSGSRGCGPALTGAGLALWAVASARKLVFCEMGFK